MAYRSTDGGGTWQVVATDDSGTTSYERYYWAAASRGTMYLQAEHVNGGAPLRAFNGTSWTTSADEALLGVRGQQRRGVRRRIVCMGPTGGVNAFDGTRTVQTSLTSYLYDLAVPGDGYIYALTLAGIHRSADGLTWTGLATAPANARSIAVQNGTVYLGTTDATIVRLQGLNAAAVSKVTPTWRPGRRGSPGRHVWTRKAPDRLRSGAFVSRAQGGI